MNSVLGSGHMKRVVSIQASRRPAVAAALWLFATAGVLLGGEKLDIDSPEVPHGSVGMRAFFLPLVGHGTMGDLRFSTEITFLNLSTTLAGPFSIATFDDSGDPANLLEGPEGQVTSGLGFSSLSGSGAFTVHSLNQEPDTVLDSGWARVSTSSPMGLEVVFRIVNTRTGDLITAANVTVESTRRAASFTARVTPGVDTGVSFLNPPVNPEAEVSIRAVNSAGAVAEAREFTLQPGEQTAGFISQTLGLTDFIGSIEIESSVSIAILPLRQEEVVLTTQDLFPPRE